MKKEKELNLGDFKVREKVLEVIAGLAALEVKGVASLKGGVIGNLSTLVGGKSTQGVKAFLKDKAISVDIHLAVNYGEVIKEVARQVQKNVKSTLESMVKFEVERVNVFVDEVCT